MPSLDQENFPGQLRRRWADFSSPEASPRREATPVFVQDGVGEVSVRWDSVEISRSTSRPPLDDRDTEEAAEAAGATPDVQERCWRDLASDGESLVKLEALGAEVSEAKPRVHAQAPRRARPLFTKPTREARTRQLQGKLAEFCTLSFDDVDAAQQYGLTFRMLALLRSLAEPLSYWEDDEKQEVEAFALLGLEEEVMFIIGRAVRKATNLADDQRYHDAYNKLCGARAWFLSDCPEALQEKRAELRAAARERRAVRKERGRGQPESGDEEGAERWTEVPARMKRRPDARPCTEGVDPLWAEASQRLSQRLSRLGRHRP